MPNQTGKFCESCLMPFSQDTGTRESDKYCSLCFKDGDFCYKGDLKGFQKICYDSMRQRGMNRFMAAFYTWMIKFAPRWQP